MFSARSFPNLLGLFRILFTPLLVWLVLTGGTANDLWAIALLVLMAVSDLADGKIARRLNVVSPLGVFLDTISDKIFVTGVLIPMVERGLLSTWVAFTIVVRDFVISGLRSYAAAEGEVIAAGTWGKQKLTITVIALVWRLLASSAEATPGGLASFGLLGTLLGLWPVGIALALIWTVGSGLEYLWRAWPMLSRGWKPEENSE
jgi:CDP-diacylglycerol---glycerol-3-phosphate 3-phosphatidyltransferase